ncbi:MAG: type II secretion system F family protein [SAR324 cluster bacterium]|nr:type II secretion system F family protein [SAR324 cluster bacterium]
MAYYFWHGLDFQGSRVSGAFKVPKRIDAIKKLRKKGIFRSRLHEISPYRLKSPVPLTQLVSILIQLERLQKSGFPLNRSLQLIVSETSDPPLAYALCKIRQDLQQGHSFSQAWLSQTALPEMVGRMLGVFESSGKLKEGLGHLLKFYESELQLRNEQIKLIHYPIILGLFFLVLGSGLLLFLIPMFKSLYHRLGPELFWLTRMLVKFSDSLLEQPPDLAFSNVVNRNRFDFSFQESWLGKNQILDSGFWSTGFPVQDAALFPVDGTAVEIRCFVE